MTEGNKLIVTSESDLTLLIRSEHERANKTLMEEVKKAMAEKAKPVLHSRKVTASEILKCSLVHLWSETKKGHIKSTMIGNKVMYLSTNIQAYLDTK